MVTETSSVFLLLFLSSVTLPVFSSLPVYPLNHSLTFMMMTSFGQYGFDSSGLIPAADMALEDINSNSDVLPGYNLGYDVLRDSQVHSCIHV